MNIFDIIGPVMVGPSSSHTAGAVRIGNVSRKLIIFMVLFWLQVKVMVQTEHYWQD